jgi:hypothetical protein
MRFDSRLRNILGNYIAVPWRYSSLWLSFSPAGAPERAVELVEQRLTHLWSTKCGAQPIVVLCIKLCERHSSPLLYQLVQTHTSRARSP